MKMTRRYAAASGCASGGVFMSARIVGVSSAPTIAITTDARPKNDRLVPTMRFTSCRRRAPTAWPTSTLLAMLTPNTMPSRKNSSRLAFEVADNAASPR